MNAVQYDLFGEVLAAEQQADADERTRLRDGLTCLADSDPSALKIILGIREIHTGEVRAGKSGNWAYAAHRDGYYFEHVDTWGGWYAKPRHRLAWVELDALIGDHYLLPQVRAWEQSLTAPDAWRDRTRPFEFWHNPEGWHDHFLERDHDRPGWPERYEAWRSTIRILHRAAERAEAGWSS